MSNDIKIGINISDGGSGEKVHKVAKEIKGALEDAVTAAARIPAALTAAKMGVDNSNAMRSSTTATPRGPSRATRAPAGVPGDELKEYGISRGISGATGAASRDFAKQAQGLGGLVHVYATFAANLFAVTAAFSALSKAADTTNMVKGLDQLSAASGRSLGSLAKQLSAVTDGAVSMREAMTATAQASAGGMTNEAILRMGNVAKQASQALGVAMPDALSRISRGITKLEPELLDEIGILVRVDKASEEYAKKLGKATSSLTDFEKRQGFANAVLEQGEKKFSAIKIDANPYAKILASMENIAQTGLELVNKVLGPLLNLLSSSPTALATAMAGIGVVLLKQALPALGAWRENLQKLAIEAKGTSERINTSFAEYQVAQSQKHGDEIQKRIQVEKDAAVKSLNIAKDATKIAGLSKGKVFDITQNVPKTIEAQAAAYKLLDTQIASNTTRGLNLAASDAKAAKAALDRADALKTLKAQLPELIRLEKELEAARLKAEQEIHAKPTIGSETWARETNARKARIGAAKAEVLSNVGANTETMGIAGAWNQAKADIAEKGLKGLDSATTKMRAGFLIATSTIGTFMNALSGIMMIVGLVVTGFSLLNSWLSTNSKEAEKFSNSLSLVNDSLDNLDRTIDFIANKDPLTVFSVETIQARANALQGLSDSLSSLVKDFKAAQNAASWWDNGIDALWDAIGRGSADKLSTNIAKSISAGILGAANDAAKSEAIAKLQQILGKDIDVTNVDQVNTALRKLGNAEVAVAGELVKKVLTDISLSANNAAFALNAAAGRITEISNLVQTQNLALLPTDAIGKLGTSILSSASDIAKGLQDPINSMLTLNKLVDDSRALSILSPAVAQELISANKDIKDLNDTYSKLQSDLVKGEKELQDLKTAKTDTVTNIDEQGYSQQVESEAAYLVKASIDRVKLAIVAAETKMTAVSSVLSAKVAEDFVNIGLAKLNSSLKAAMSEGAIVAAKGYLSVLKEVGVGTADAEAKLGEQERAMQKQLLDATYNQIRSQQRNTNTLELVAISNKILANTLELAYARTPEAEKLAKENKLGLDKELKDAVSKVRITEMKPEDALKLKEGGDISKEVLAGMAPYLSSITGYLSGLAKQGGAAEAARITDFARKQKEVLGQEQRPNVTRIGEVGTELQDINAAIALSAEYDKALSTKKEALEIEKRTLEYTNEALKISTDLRIIEEARKGGKVSEKELEKGIKDIQADSVAKAKKFISDKNKITLDAQKEEISGLEAIRQKEESKANLIRTENQAIADIKLTQQSEELRYLESIGAITASDAARKQTDIGLTQQSVEFEKQRVEQAQKYVNSFMELEGKKQLAGKGTTDAAKFQEQQDALLASYLRQVSAQDLLNTGKVTAITLAGQQDILAKSQAEQMEKMVSVTESLSTIFGELGSSVGKVGEAILKMAQDDENYLKNKTTLEDKLFDAIEKNDPKAEASALKSLSTLEKKRTTDEISNIGKIAGASKKVFSEKTAAYKILDGIEKATAAYKMAMQIKELAMDFKNFAIKIGLIEAEVPAVAAATAAKTGIEIGGQAATMPAKIAGVYASFMSMLGPFGPPAAALAIAAFIGSFAGGSKGGTVNTAGLTAEDMQKSQGTGQKWQDGKLVATGGGVLGDTEAKSNSIQNSLDMIESTSIEGTAYSNKSLGILQSINDGIDEVSIALYKTVGISTGTGFDTVEGSASTPGFLGAFASSSSTEIINSGIKFAGTLTNVVMTQFEDVLKKSSNSGFFGLFSSSSEQLINNVKQLNVKTSTAFDKVFKHMGELFVEQGEKLGVSAESINTALSSIPIEVQASLKGLKGKELREELGYVLSGIQDDISTKLFPSLVKFQKFGEGMSETVNRINTTSINLKEALARIGISLTETVETIAPIDPALVTAKTSAQTKVTRLTQEIIDKPLSESYSQGGDSEQWYTRFIPDPKLISELAVANDELTTATLNLANATGQSTTNNIETETAIVTALGGLDKYQEALGFFGDNFLSEAERLSIASTDVTSKMLAASSVSIKKVAALGSPGVYLDIFDTYAQDLFKTISDGKNGVIDTKEEFKNLFNATVLAAGGTDDTAISARKLLPLLVGVQNQFYEVADAAEAAAEKTAGLENELLIAQGKKSEALYLTRQLELKTMTATDAALKIRIWMLQDEKEIMSAANSQQVAILNLLNKSEEALAITRKTELENMDAQLRPRQEYLYALQDENTIRDKLKSTLKTNSDSLKGFIKSLTDARNSLVLGASSTLTPEQKYIEAKAQKDAIAKAATATATTSSEIAARNEALSKLPSATATFLDASRGLFASSEQYTQDFNSVEKLLNETTTNLIAQQTDVEKQLTELTSIGDTLDTIEGLTQRLTAASETTATKLVNYEASGTGGVGTSTAVTPQVTSNYTMPKTAASDIEGLYTSILKRSSDAGGKGYWLAEAEKGMSFSSIKSAFENSPEAKAQMLYEKLAGRIGEPGGVGYWQNLIAAGESKPGIIKSFAEGVVAKEPANATDLAKQLAVETDPSKLLNALPGFAKGGIASGLAMVGERGPELVDFATPSRVYSNKASNDLLNNRELIAEIKNLRKEVAELRADQREQTGHLIASNYDANSANAKEIAKATEEAAQAQVWSERSKVKLA